VEEAYGPCLGPHDEGAVGPGPGRRAAAGGQAAVEFPFGRAAVGLGFGQVAGGALVGVAGRGLLAASVEPAGGIHAWSRVGPVAGILGGRSPAWYAASIFLAYPAIGWRGIDAQVSQS
jgi:hypothetical protein